jgi:hypothetical protein
MAMKPMSIAAVRAKNVPMVRLALLEPIANHRSATLANA